MAFNIFFRIPFVSFRNGTSYVVNVYKDGTPPSGYPLTLKGAEEPFVTDEDADDDVFMPVRTQSGSLRIVDDGWATDTNNQTVAFSWRDMAAANDMDTPVRLMAGSTIVWQGFMQSQTYGNTLYGNPQELEFPVQCCLSVLEARQISNDSIITGQLHNFAFLLQYMLSEMPFASFTQIVVQGNTDAQAWLLKKFDWQNFLDSNDEETDKPRYTDLSVLEDMCRFWGWTARTQGTVLYLMCADDSSEQEFLTLNSTQLNTLADGRTAGSTGGSFTEKTLTPEFTSTESEDYQVRGPNKATVKGDCNKQDTVMQFAPKVVRDILEEGNEYTWVTDGDDSQVGFFTTAIVKSFASQVMSGTSLNPSETSVRGFCRRQIFSSTDSDKATKVDIISVDTTDAQNLTARVSINSERARSYGGGSLGISGTVWNGSQQWDDGTSDYRYLLLHVGIGATYATAQWFSMSISGAGVITQGWATASGTPPVVRVQVKSGQLKGFACYPPDALLLTFSFVTETIPVPDGLNGKIFIDVVGMEDVRGNSVNYVDSAFQVGDLSIDFTREETFIPTSIAIKRPRTMNDERQSSAEYTSSSFGKTDGEWNADCIFASDNNMEYGYGLLMNANGTFMGKLTYNGSPTDQYAEQHLANRVATFWQSARRKVYLELTASNAGDITPRHKVTFDGTVFHPISISRNWRDDIVELNMIQI